MRAQAKALIYAACLSSKVLYGRAVIFAIRRMVAKHAEAETITSLFCKQTRVALHYRLRTSTWQRKLARSQLVRRVWQHLSRWILCRLGHSVPFANTHNVVKLTYH